MLVEEGEVVVVFVNYFELTMDLGLIAESKINESNL